MKQEINIFRLYIDGAETRGQVHLPSLLGLLKIKF